MSQTPTDEPWFAPFGNHGQDTAANQMLVRETNLGLLLDALYTAGGGLSRAELSALTGLTKATTSRLVAEALDLRLVEEAAQQPAPGKGRPSTPLQPARNTLVGIGLEVNVDHIGGVAIDLAGRQVAQFGLPGDYADSDPVAVLNLLSDACKQMVKELEDKAEAIAGVSVAVPGLVDAGEGEVIYAPNLGWRHVKPTNVLRDAFPPGTAFSVHNDADLQAVAAQVAANRRGNELGSFIYLSGDTGIGGALVTGQEHLTGDRGWAGEIGHTSVEPDGRPCHCGAQGCLETYAGWRAIAESAGLNWQDGPTALRQMLEEDDPKAKRAVEQAGWALGIALANAIKLLDIRTVVLGTSLGAIEQWLVPDIQTELSRRMLGGSEPPVAILSANGGDHPAAVGGALQALRLQIREPTRDVTPLSS